MSLIKNAPPQLHMVQNGSLKHKVGTQEKFYNHHPSCQAIWAAGQKVHKYIWVRYRKTP